MRVLFANRSCVVRSNLRPKGSQGRCGAYKHASTESYLPPYKHADDHEADDYLRKDDEKNGRKEGH